MINKEGNDVFEYCRHNIKAPLYLNGTATNGNVNVNTSV